MTSIELIQRQGMCVCVCVSTCSYFQCECICVCVCVLAGSSELLVGEFQTANQQLSIRTSLLRFSGKTTSGRASGRGHGAWLVVAAQLVDPMGHGQDK